MTRVQDERPNRSYQRLTAHLGSTRLCDCRCSDHMSQIRTTIERDETAFLLFDTTDTYLLSSLVLDIGRYQLPPEAEGHHCFSCLQTMNREQRWLSWKVGGTVFHRIQWAPSCMPCRRHSGFAGLTGTCMQQKLDCSC